MRGKGGISQTPCVNFRITPAYAGKSIANGYQINTCKDHPRLCGEKCVFLAPLVLSVGSPPPMRGKGHLSSLRLLVAGITPAYAGKSENWILFKIESKDHPRLCGEKRVFGIAHLRPTGITPAYAGKRR